MSDDLIKSVEKYLGNISEELMEKIDTLNQRLKKISEENYEILASDEQESMLFSSSIDTLSELNDHGKNFAVTQELNLGDLQKSNSNEGNFEKVETILNELKSTLTSLTNSYKKEKEILSDIFSEEFTLLEEDEKQYITKSTLQTIDERLSGNRESPKDQIPISNNKSDKVKARELTLKSPPNLLNENMKRELSYKTQQIKALQKIITEGEFEAEQLKQKNIDLTITLNDIKDDLDNLKQFQYEKFLENENSFQNKSETNSTIEKYKTELEKLRNVLGKRKEEIKELKNNLEIEKEKTNSLSKIEKGHNDLIRKVLSIIHEAKKIPLEDTLDLDDQLNQLRLLVMFSDKVYAPRIYLNVLQFLSSNPHWLDIHSVARKLDLNPGVLQNTILELVDLKLVKYDSENNKISIIIDK